MRRIPFLTHRFSICGLNLERFINTLQKENVPLLSARRADARTLVCQCFSADLPRVSALAQQKGWKLQNAEPTGLSAALCGLRRRPGLWVGAALALMLALTLTRFVWRVELTGAGAYQADIAAYLASEGLRPGAPKARVDAGALEQKLLYRYPELSWFHVYVYNVTLAVEVVAGVPMPDLPAPGPENIYAARDGVVESVRVYAGTARVKAGDIVRKGQLLIAGEERGADEAQTPVCARGEVIARCWRSHAVSMSVYEIKSEETGRKDVQTRVVTPWLTLPSALEGPPYLAHNDVVTAFPVVGCFFPVAFEIVERREVMMEYAPRDARDVRAEAATAAHQRLSESLRGYEIIDKWTDYCMIEDGVLSATATAEWRMNIGGSRPP